MTKLYRYHMFGLVVVSDMVFPELAPGDPNKEPDVSIRQGHVAVDGLPGGAIQGPFCYTTTEPKQFWLTVPEIARYQVNEGREIVVDPFPDVDEASIRVFLLGSCMGALLMQRGLLVLHGNAIRIGDNCFVCVGPSGIGKSTLAAAFLQRGHDVLADDVVAVNDNCEAIPGFARLKIWQDAADQLKISTEGLRRIRPGIDKFDMPLREGFKSSPLPIKWVYVLQVHNQQEFSLQKVTGMDRFTPLRNNTYRFRYLIGMELKPRHLKLCGELAGKIHLARLRRPEKIFKLDELVDIILADVAAHPMQH
ncbi:MAG: hypothetical protein V4568_16425 [Pseudomonadota bacterium]